MQESQVDGYVAESQDCAVGSALRGDEQNEEEEVCSELGLPNLSMQDKCERLQREQADLRLFNIACTEDDRR